MPIDRNQFDKLDAIGLETLLSHVKDGMSMNKIAKKYKLTRSCLYDWCMQPGNLQAFNKARTDSAEAYADLAADTIIKAQSKLAVEKAKALAMHYRWMAKMKDPATFSDKTKVEHSGGINLIELLTPKSNIVPENPPQDANA